MYIKADNIQGNNAAAGFGTRNVTAKELAVSLGFDGDRVLSVKQMHTDNIVLAEGTVTQDKIQAIAKTEADAVITNIHNLPLSVRTADCVPILIYDSVNKAIAAVHSGWRGTFMQIGIKTLVQMTETFGTNPSDVCIAIGPAISKTCYEVGLDLYNDFINKFGAAIGEFFERKDGKNPCCDLKAINRAFFTGYGVPEGNIDVSDLCTYCDSKLFYSYRRDGKVLGSMHSIIGLK